MNEQINNDQFAEKPILDQNINDSLVGLFSKRIIDATELAAIFEYSKHWTYRIMKGNDPPPRCKTHTLKFDTQAPNFRAWMKRHLGHTLESKATPTVDNAADHA